METINFVWDLVLVGLTVTGCFDRVVDPYPQANVGGYIAVCAADSSGVCQPDWYARWPLGLVIQGRVDVRNQAVLRVCVEQPIPDQTVPVLLTLRQIADPLYECEWPPTPACDCSLYDPEEVSCYYPDMPSPDAEPTAAVASLTTAATDTVRPQLVITNPPRGQMTRQTCYEQAAKRLTSTIEDVAEQQRVAHRAVTLWKRGQMSGVMNLEVCEGYR